jgi:hypothetical protein
MKLFSLFFYFLVPLITAYQSNMSSRILYLSTRLIGRHLIQVAKPTVFPRNQMIFRATFTTKQKNIGLSEEDTVVSRCEQKISQLLKPSKIKVTSTNDDPNGSHVRSSLCLSVILFNLFISLFSV